MIEFYGTKRLYAEPMNRAAYNRYRGWSLPANEEGGDEGYLVEYADGGKPNDDRHKGYISWSPKAQFENAYQRTDALNFGHALQALKEGYRLARAGWNGKGMFVYLVQGSTFQVNRPPLLGIYVEGTRIDYQPHIDIRHPNGTLSTWSPSNGDVLAEDWGLVGP